LIFVWPFDDTNAAGNKGDGLALAIPAAGND
jgi:hypothetical protein